MASATRRPDQGLIVLGMFLLVAGSLLLTRWHKDFAAGACTGMAVTVLSFGIHRLRRDW
jgi:hypothetical protein